MSRDVIVVGAGLFGATIARALAAEGMNVAVYDDGRPLAGSAPSGNLMKPGWFAGLGKDVYNPALEMLDKLYGVKDLTFRIWPSRLNTKVHWVDNRVILDWGDLTLFKKTVTAVESGRVEVDTGWVEADTVIVANGYWAKGLIPDLQLLLQGKKGISFRWTQASDGENVIKPWAPYKQSVVFEEGIEGQWWGGDGSAILEKNWTEEREKQCLTRVSKAAGQPIMTNMWQRVGIRPFIKKHKPCYLQEKNGIWIATGGAKNGTIAAGWAAHKLVEVLM